MRIPQRGAVALSSRCFGLSGSNTRLAETIDHQAEELEALIASGNLQDVQWTVPENNRN